MKATVCKVDDELGIVFGWAIISTENGEPYFDLQDEHIPEDEMLKAAADFMGSNPELKMMHVGKSMGRIVFAWPLTAELAKAFGLETKTTGLMIGAKPDSKAVLEKYKAGSYTGFSIGGAAYHEEVE